METVVNIIYTPSNSREHIGEFSLSFDGFDGVHIFHFGTDTQFVATLGANRKVNVATHRTLFHTAFGNLCKTKQRTKALSLCVLMQT